MERGLGIGNSGWACSDRPCECLVSLPLGEVRCSRERHVHPLFLVSVAGKGLSGAISLLFAILAGKSISVAAKGVGGASCWGESNDERYEEFVGVRRTV